jgi:apolipoprotein N-acyltransferase
VVLVVGFAVPLPTDGAPTNVMAVQGSVPRAGLDFNAERRQVLDNHVTATEDAAAEVAAGTRPKPDLVVWPENASDIDPTRNPDAQDEILRAVDALGTPLVVGTLLEQPAPDISNVALLYEPGKGITQTYVKQHPVPFAEYIPNRDFFRRFSDKVDLVRSDFAAGTGPVLFRVPAAAGGEVVAGPTICFEVAYDDLVRANVDLGANLLLVQTNNATFGYSNESVQQLAISRIRAMEHGRSVVHVSTVGVSGLITPDGTVHQPSALFTRTVLSGQLPLRSARTVATMVGPWPEYAAGLAFVVVLLVGLRRRPTAPPHPHTGRPPSRERTAPRMTAPMTEPQHRPPLGRVVVLIPTYDERENLPRIVERVRSAVPTVDILVLDDNSPDGTGAVADELATSDPQVHVLHRPGKQGLGAAYLAGFTWALDRGYDAAVEMDADGSHQPEQLPALLDAAEHADVVIGSRWVSGGSVVNWPMSRRVLSVGGNVYVRVLLGMSVHDATGGYRVYRASALHQMDLHSVESQGYGFQVDMTWRAVQAGLTVVEVPIEFVERVIGESKMSGHIVQEAMLNVTKWSVTHRVDRLRGRARSARSRREEAAWHRL